MTLDVVSTASGDVRGLMGAGRHEGIVAFNGIPFAAPPVGALRWAPPIAPAPWSGIRDCIAHGPIAVQSGLGGRHADEYYFNGIPDMSEDCLYLNVATGAQDAGERRPVYMYFHGGGLTNCFPHEPQLDPGELARKGVVVVTVGHRLNAFGFLSLPQLTAERGWSGNYGLLDLIASFEWVTENIAAFGGDPDRITVGGQSGGCLKSTSLVLAAPTRGGIRGVINQSGNKWTHRFTTQAEGERIGIRYLKHIGIDPSSTLEDLRALPAERIFRDAPRGVMPDHLIRDGRVIQHASMAEGLLEHATGVHFLNGNNLGETNEFSASHLAGDAPTIGAPGPIDTVEQFREHYDALLGDVCSSQHLDEILDVTDANAESTSRRLAALGVAGYEFNNAARSTALNLITGEELAAHTGAVSYTYLWSHLLPVGPEGSDPERDPERVGAWHSSELWFTFGSLAPGVPPHRPWRPVDYALADATTTYFANFIASGTPYADGLPDWPPSDRRRGWMEFVDSPEPRFGLGGIESLIVEFTRGEYGIPTQHIEPTRADEDGKK